MSKTVDLSTLAGWLTLSVGPHTVTVVAKASGYRDSEASSGVTLEKWGTLLLIGTNCTLTATTVRNGETVTLKHGDALYLNETVTWSASAKAGYRMAEGDRAGTLVADAAAFAGSTEIRIAKTALANQYTVTANLSHLTLSDTANVSPEQAYTTKLTADTGYTVPQKSKITITVGGAAYTDYTYSAQTDGSVLLTIPKGAITGDVVITAAGEVKAYTLHLHTQNAETTAVSTERAGKAVTLADGDTVYFGEVLTYSATATPGYMSPQAETVISGSETVESDVNLYFIFDQNGIYAVSTVLSGLTFSGEERATHGTTYTAILNPSDSGDLPEQPTITIGGESYTGFSWNAVTGSLSIPGADIVGDIVITASSQLPQLTKPKNLSLSGTNLSWDAVNHADSYEILVDGAVIGTVQA